MPLEIYQIDLDPSGTAFALSKPKLEGDVYVFTVWPEKTVVRLPKAKVKQMTQRTKDLDKEVVYEITLNPSGRMIASAEPKMQGKTYVFNRWKDGALMSLRGSDVQKVTRLTGLPAFKAQQEEMGAALIGNLPMEGGGTVRTIGTAPKVHGVSGRGRGPERGSAPRQLDLSGSAGRDGCLRARQRDGRFPRRRAEGPRAPADPTTAVTAPNGGGHELARTVAERLGTRFGFGEDPFKPRFGSQRLQERTVLGHEGVRIETLVDRLLEHVQGPVAIAGQAKGLGKMKLVVGIERRDVDRRESFKSRLLPAFEPVDERQELPCVGHVGPGLAEV